MSLTSLSQLPLTASDLVCVDDLDPLALETTSDLQNLEQDVLHILQETYGSNLDDINRGIGVPEMLSGSTVPLQTLPKVIDTQLTKDARIDKSKTTITQNSDQSFNLEIQVTVNSSVVPINVQFSAVNGLTLIPAP